jgi:phosphate transport system protein
MLGIRGMGIHLSKTGVSNSHLFLEMRKCESQVNEIVVQLLSSRQLAVADIPHLLDCMKINSTLGRIGTLALNSADLGLSFIGTWTDLPNYIPKLGLTASSHLHRALQAFSDADGDLAASLMEDADIVVLMRSQEWIRLVEKMKSCPDATDQALRAVMIVKNLEDITEHAKGIAQCVLSSL